MALVLMAALAGCGTVVPRLSETYDGSDDLTGDLMVQAIVHSVRCELERGVTSAINDAVDTARLNGGGRTNAEFLNDWGAEVALTLTVVEKTAVSPSALLMPASPASAVLTIAGGVSLTAKATRIEKLNFFYTVRSLYRRDGDPVCDASGENARGSLLVHNDLKIVSALRPRIIAISLGQATAPSGKENVISHQITFEAIADGNVTPSIKLVRATVNPSGQLSDTNRDRTHDLLVTFGPIDKKQGGKTLVAIAEQSHFTSQITSGFRTAFPQ